MADSPFPYERVPNRPDFKKMARDDLNAAVATLRGRLADIFGRKVDAMLEFHILELIQDLETLHAFHRLECTPESGLLMVELRIRLARIRITMRKDTVEDHAFLALVHESLGVRYS